MKTGLFLCLVDGFLYYARLVTPFELVQQFGHAVDETDPRAGRNNAAGSHVMFIHIK